MKNIDFKKIYPHLIVIALFIAICMAYFSPVLNGKKVKQDDIVRHQGMSKEIADYRDKNGSEPLWTNSMFGGMPAYQISVAYPNNWAQYIEKMMSLWLPHPLNILFLYLIGFYILLMVLKFDPWTGAVGAIAFAFSSYLFIIIEAGHNSKALAIAFMPMILAGIILAFRGKYLWGALLTALFMALELRANHPQITYYMMLMVLIYGVGELIHAIQKKLFPNFIKAILFLIPGVILALMINITGLWSTMEYSKYTIRGPTELKSEQANRTSGLDKDYATDWSYGISESMTLLVPNFKGGASVSLGENKSAMKEVDAQFRENIAQQGQYYGDQPFTSGPVYAGAIIMFLFILGILIVDGYFKWVLIAATLLSLLLAWGKNFMPLTDFFLDYVPGYNKFRAVSMTMVIAEFTIPILAMLALLKTLKEPEFLKKNKRALYIAFGLSGGLALLMWLIPSLFTSFLSVQEIAEFDKYRKVQGQDPAMIDKFVSSMESARMYIFKMDAIRSFLFVLLGGALIWFYAFKKMNKNIVIAGIGLLVLIDLWAVDKRYLNNDDFMNAARLSAIHNPTPADQTILNDKEDYRVLNLAVSTFNDASTSYYHKSIGGYHGAKLRRYQELIELRLGPEIDRFIKTLNNKPTDSSINAVLQSMKVVNMLNTRYIIYNNEAPPVVNRHAKGNAWFVNEYRIVENADQEIKALENFGPVKVAIIDKRFADQVANYKNTRDSLGTIKLTSYQPNKLVYESNTSKEQLAVFSEIYYDKGWNAFIDEKPAPYFRADYVLRAMIVPSGKHKIEFRFEPEVYYTGEKIAMAGSIILVLSLLGAAFYEIRKRMRAEK
ncbi:MAG: YfhO family protein [Bacteroidota bacterium]